MKPVSKIKPCLWFDGDAETAAGLYVSLFADGAIGSVSRYGEGAPFPAGTALVVEFSLAGQAFQALNGGPQYKLTEAVSFAVSCADQDEIDRLWDGLCADGGAPGRCGWLKDRFGVSWQITPAGMGAILGGPDPAGRGRAMRAMMSMGRLEIAALEAAYRGEAE